MIRLTSLDKKLFIVQHKMTIQELQELKMPEEEVKKLIQQNIYNKVIQLLFQTTKVRQRAEAEGLIWEYKMFMFSDRELYNLLLEVCELNEEDRQHTILECKKLLGMWTNMSKEDMAKE